MQTSPICKFEGFKIVVLIKAEIHCDWFVIHSIQITLNEDPSYANLSHTPTSNT